MRTLYQAHVLGVEAGIGMLAAQVEYFLQQGVIKGFEGHSISRGEWKCHMMEDLDGKTRSLETEDF